MELDKIINTIQLGDCYELIKNIPDKTIDLVYIDIPYLYAKGGDVSNDKSAVSKRIAKVRNEYLKNISSGIDYYILDELCRVMKYIYIYIWCSKEQVFDIMKYFIEKKKCNFNLLVWCKTNPTPACAGTYLPDLEYCLVFKEKGSPKYNDGYELKSKWYISSLNVKDKDKYQHPTIKPLDYVKRHILHSTQPNDIVLDCFCGSGTTCVACKETNRRYIGMEIDPAYYKIAVDRLNGINANGQMSIFTDFEKVDNER